jgi:hypothetical protein
MVVVIFNINPTPALTANTTYSIFSVTSPSGCTRTSGFTVGSVTVTVNQPATTTDPGNQTVTAPAGATFSVTAGGTSPTYQWQEDAGSGFVNISNGGIYSGATSSTLSLSSTTYPTMNGYKYRCVVTVATCGSVTSAAATLTVNNPCAPVAITTAYSNISANNDADACGAIVNYTAAATTGTAPVNVTYSKASGTLFPVGTTTVTVTATNACGTDTKTF